MKKAMLTIILAALVQVPVSAFAAEIIGSDTWVVASADDRQDRRQERGRSDERRDRRDCRRDEGLVGQDKRECKQEEVRDGITGNQGGKDDSK